MRRQLLVSVAAMAVLAVSGCGGSGDGGSDLPVCSERYGDGVETIDFADVCTDENGESLVPVMLLFDCDDGRRFAYNSLGAGFVGEPWSATAVEDSPEREAMFGECHGY